MPRFQFIFDVGRPAIEFIIEKRPHITFDFQRSVIHHHKAGRGTAITFFTERRPVISFCVGVNNRHSCGEIYMGYRFMDSLVNSALKGQVLYLHGEIDDVMRELHPDADAVSMDLMHGSYRESVLGDWDDHPLLDIDPNLIGMKVLGKLEVHVRANYPDTWRMLADKDGNVLEAAEEAVLVADG